MNWFAGNFFLKWSRTAWLSFPPNSGSNIRAGLKKKGNKSYIHKQEFKAFIKNE